MKDLKYLEKYRIENPMYRALNIAGNPTYLIPDERHQYFVICSSTYGWEHVSVSLRTFQNTPINRTPKWDEMCKIKDLFWDDDETVIQYHPAKSEYVNNHPYVLHLWRPIDIDFPIPPKKLV